MTSTASAHLVTGLHLKFAPMARLVLGSRVHAQRMATWWRDHGYAVTIAQAPDPRITGILCLPAEGGEDVGPI